MSRDDYIEVSERIRMCERAYHRGLRDATALIVEHL